MELEVKQRIVSEVQKYMKEHNLSQADIATRSGVRKEYVSIILRDGSDFTYSAGDKVGLIPAKHFFNLGKLVGFSVQKEYWEIQPTEQFTQVVSYLKESKEYGSTYVIIGETGSGKTVGIRQFEKKNPHDTFIITIGSTDTLGDIIDKIVDALKITTGKSKAKKLKDIAEKLLNLKSMGLMPQLIFDESEYMKQPALCSIKELYDNLHFYCSIVLIGTDQLTQNIEKLRKRNKQGIPQLYRRIKYGIRVLPPIDKKYTLFISDLEDKQLQKFLMFNCDNYGELHDAMVPALREADRLQVPLTEGLIKKVLNIPDNSPVWH